MSVSIKSWLGQVTTGHGMMVLAPTLLSVLSGSTTWSAAAPLLVAGAVGLAWPENTGLRSASQAAAADVANMISAYQIQKKAG